MAFVKLTVLLFVGITVHGSFADNVGRMAAGQSAHDGEFPYYASLRLIGHHLCSGAIISPSHILTASHCVRQIKSPYTDLTVVTGSVKRLGGQTHQVKNVTSHFNFIEKPDMSLINDLAVVTLQAPMIVDGFQSPISIATSDTSRGSVAVITGFGRHYTDGPSPDTLVATNVFVLPIDECQMMLNSHLYLTHLCTVSGGRDSSCHGDDGSPVVYDNELIGIISWTQRRCGNGTPDVSTKVMYYDKFIADAMQY